MFTNRAKCSLSLFLSCWMVLATCPGVPAYAVDQTSSTPADVQTPSTPLVSAPPSAQELQQLVAPIALYPDSLVAQILAGAAYPEQIVEADRWLQAHPELKGDQLGQAVDQQDWDPSVKALTEFPSVLANMDKNLSWTTSLGEVYDHEGKANPALATYARPGEAARPKRYAAWGWLIAGSLVCFWIDWQQRGALILPTVIGINMIFAGLRLIYWGGGRPPKRRAKP